MTTKPGPTNTCFRSHSTWFLQYNLQYTKLQNYAWQHFNITAITFTDKLYFYWLVPLIPLIFQRFCSFLKRPPALENQFPIVSFPAERRHYCLFEGRQNLFSRTDRLILMTWLNMLSIVVSAASKGKQEILERNFYKSGRFDQAIVLQQSWPLALHNHLWSLPQQHKCVMDNNNWTLVQL